MSFPYPQLSKKTILPQHSKKPFKSHQLEFVGPTIGRGPLPIESMGLVYFTYIWVHLVGFYMIGNYIHHLSHGCVMGYCRILWKCNALPTIQPRRIQNASHQGDIVARLTEGLGRLRTLTEVTMTAPEVGKRRGDFFSKHPRWCVWIICHFGGL